MKISAKFILVCSLLCACIVATTQVHAQYRRTPDRSRTRTATPSLRNNLIKVNFISPIAATGSFFYERVINERMSGQLGLQFTSYAGFFTGGERLRGYAITPEFRYYLSTVEAPKGFYVAPFLRYRNSSLTGDFQVANRQFDGTITITTFGGGVLIGGQWLIRERLSLEAFIGPTISGRSYQVTQGSSESDYRLPDFFSPVWFRTGVTVGVAF